MYARRPTWTHAQKDEEPFYNIWFLQEAPSTRQVYNVEGLEKPNLSSYLIATR